MAELAATYNDAFNRFLNLIDFVPSERSVKEVEQLQSQTSLDEASNSEEVQRKLFLEDVDWSRYSPQIQASLTEIQYLFKSAYERKTRTITNFRLFNDSLKKLNEFVIKYWLELEDEDRQMFELMAVQLINALSIKRTPVKAIVSFLKSKLQLTIKKLLPQLGLRKKNSSDLPLIKFDKRFRRMFYRSLKEPKANNIFYKIVNSQIIFANTVLRLSGRYNLIDESLYFVEALDKVDPVRGNGGDLTWEEQEIVSDAYIRRQAALFDTLPKEKLLPYKGQYVFFEEGEIKDSDVNKIKLAKRIFKKEGYRDLFLEKVV